MGKVGILAAVWWSASVVCAAAAIQVPPHYLEEQRCLAVLNVANAAFETTGPQSFTPATRQRVKVAYEQTQHAIASWTTLTPRQVDKGLDHFESELDHWLAAFGDANEEDMHMAFMEALFKRVERCMTVVEH
jgi:hypothetical protein